jgi:quercetin 2,3-dioxygenase
MIKIRKSKERGFANHGWLKSAHTFSFADYFDRNFMGFSELRVINEDQIDGGTGFNTHPHKDMEIVTYVIEGALKHEDSMGNKTVIKPGEVQRMSAGTGIRHSEHNNNSDQKCHLLQIWIMPDKIGITPSYGQKDFSSQIETNDLVLTVSPEAKDGVVTMQQNAKIYVSRAKTKKEIALPLSETRNGWIQMISGTATLGDNSFESGDGVAITQEKNPRMKITSDAHFLFFDLP